MSLNYTVEHLVGDGYSTTVVVKIRDTLLSSVTAGGMFNDLVEGLRSQIIGEGGKEGVLGMKEDTDADNFFIRCGGWNCNHILTPVSVEKVPLGIRQRIYGAQEKKSFQIVEEKIDVQKGKSMSFEEANELKGNPLYKTGREGYSINCQSCVVANELRRRGFDVQAQENTGVGSSPNKLARDTELAWVDPVTKSKPISKTAGGSYIEGGKIKNKTLKMLNTELKQLLKEEGRYNIKMLWKKNIGRG
ncbi:hypothetical protein AwDysgo_21810 [Bacteroidales bacterium]|nr:hypothetical protein AwDysgo_21810 [Bacteroidales bacterium]